SILAGFGAKLALAYNGVVGGLIELTAGDAAAAEHCLREGYEAFRAMADAGASAYPAALLAQALYAQGRLDEAQHMTQEAEKTAAPDDINPHAQWRATRAKRLPPRRQVPAAPAPLGQAPGLILPADRPATRA